MAEEIGHAAKVGDIQKCFSPSESSTIVIASKYCGLNFATEPEKFRECIIPSNYCYICCENEFGDLHIIERDKCYNKCDRTS